jgi:hypothetical protein
MRHIKINGPFIQIGETSLLRLKEWDTLKKHKMMGDCMQSQASSIGSTLYSLYLPLFWLNNAFNPCINLGPI